MNCITAIAPTICELMNVRPPKVCEDSALSGVTESARQALAGRSVGKCLVYCPDAIGLDLCRDHESAFGQVRRYAPVEVDLRSVVPPKTPVCYASMFTGAQPGVHGITKYEKPVLACDTIFDAMVRNGRSVAIVAIRNYSVDLIFRNRPLDYYPEGYDAAVTDRALEIMRSRRHDLMIVYHCEYDDCLHKTGPRSEQSINAMLNHIRSFVRLASAFHQTWPDRDRAVLVCPDHGGHSTPDGAGGHGDDIPQDMLVRHFFGFAPAEKAIQ